MTDTSDRLRSRAKAPNDWTRDDAFLIEAADEFDRQVAEIERLRTAFNEVEGDLRRLYFQDNNASIADLSPAGVGGG